MKGLLFLLLALPGLAQAQGKELRMDVAGEIGIDPQGAVSDCKIYTILTPPVEKTIIDSIRRWKFEPVMHAGVPIAAKSRLWLTLSTLPAGDQGYRLRIDKIRFLGNRKPIGDMVPVRYPKAAQRASISAVVLVAVRVDRAGNVVDAVATQSSLFGSQALARAREPVARLWRKSFEDSAVAAAKQWKFTPADPSAGEADETTLVMPVEYRIGYSQISGEWRDALASPIGPIPWLSAEKQQYDAIGLQ